MVCNNDTPAEVLAFVDGGCVVVFNEYQDLCGQHIITCEPYGRKGVTVLKEHVKEYEKQN